MMRTVYMGDGNVIATTMSHPKIKGKMICFHKSKKKYELDEEVDIKDIGKGICQIYFPDKKSVTRLINQLNILCAEFEGEE